MNAMNSNIFNFLEHSFSSWSEHSFWSECSFSERSCCENHESCHENSSSNCMSIFVSGVSAKSSWKIILPF